MDTLQANLTVMRDLVAMLEVYAQGRANNETRGQALATIREARKLMGLVDDGERVVTEFHLYSDAIAFITDPRYDDCSIRYVIIRKDNGNG